MMSVERPPQQSSPDSEDIVASPTQLEISYRRQIAPLAAPFKGEFF